MCQKNKPDDDVSKVEKAMRAALKTAGEDADIFVVELVAEAVHDAELARARAGVRVPPGLDEMLDRLRAQGIRVVDHHGGERARTEQALRDSPHALPVERPGRGSTVQFLRSAEEVAAVKRALGRDTQDERKETP